MPGTIATFQTEHLKEDRITQHTYLEFDSSHGTRAAARNLSRKYSIDFGCAARSDGLLKSARKYVHRRPSGPRWDHGPQEKRDLPSCLMAKKSAGIVPDSALHPDKRTLTDIPLSCLYSPSPPPPPGLTGTNRTEPIGGILYVVGCDHPCSVLCCTYIHTYIHTFFPCKREDGPTDKNYMGPDLGKVVRQTPTLSHPSHFLFFLFPPQFASTGTTANSYQEILFVPSAWTPFTPFPPPWWPWTITLSIVCL